MGKRPAHKRSMTTQEVNSIFDKALSENLGKPVEEVDANAKNQCVDWAIRVCRAYGLPVTVFAGIGLAMQIWTPSTQYIKDHFDFIPSTPENFPNKGDLVIFAGPPHGPYFENGIKKYAGHISVATGVGDKNTFQSSDQNWNRQVVELVTHNYNGVYGWLRLKNITNSPTPMNPNIVRKSSFFDKTWNAEYPSSNTDNVTEGEVNNQIVLNKARKEAGGKWDVLCDKAGMPHTSTPEAVIAKLSASAFDKNKFLEGVKKLLFG